MKRQSLFWGSLFIFAGALLLLDNLGFLHVNIWNLVWPSFIIAAGIWTLWTATQGPEALDIDKLNLPLDGTKQGNLTFSFGAGQIKVAGGADPNDLLNGSFAGGVEEKRREKNGIPNIQLKPSTEGIFYTIMPWTWGAREWDIALNEETQWALNFEMGASDAQINLADLQVSDLNVETGASNTEITLPANAGHTHVDLSGGAASIRFDIPEGVAARIHVDSGLASIDIDRERFPRVGDVYKSEGYETAANKVDINADFGAGSLVIR